MTSDREDVDDEEEEDFVPDDYDDDDDDEGIDFADQYDGEDDPEDFPSILQGQLFINETEKICYEQDGAFCLVCKNSFPKFTLEAPVIDSPLIFVGWIHDPSRKMEFEVVFSKESMSEDPLQIQILEAQDAMPLCEGPSTLTKTGTKYNNDKCMEKTRGNLKTPPSDSSKINSTSSADTKRKSNSKDSSSYLKAGNTIGINEGKVHNLNSSSVTPSSDVAKIDMKSDYQEMIFVISGSQIRNDSTDGSRISFRGAYRCPSKSFVGGLHLICPIQILDGSFAGGTATVAAARRKRVRSGSDDDELVEGNASVAYQELIDLHDDTRLSTEELRNRYYGSGEKKGEHRVNLVDNKRLKGLNGGCRKKEIEDDEDDDAYGF